MATSVWSASPQKPPRLITSKNPGLEALSQTPVTSVRSVPLVITPRGGANSGKPKYLQIIRWAEANLQIPFGRKQGPLKFSRWQRSAIRQMVATGIITSFITMPRRNGKSFLATIIAMWYICDSTRGSINIIAIGPSERQSKIEMILAGKIIRASPNLSHMKVKYETIENLDTGSRWEPYTIVNSGPGGRDGAGRLQGQTAEVGIVGECHLYEDGKAIEALISCLADAAEPLMLISSTAGESESSVAFALREDIGSGTNPTSVLIEYTVPPDTEIPSRDKASNFNNRQFQKALRLANPGLRDGTLDINIIRDEWRKLPEASFRRYRFNEYSSPADSWLPAGAWEALVDPLRRLTLGQEITLGFDGSLARDSTALTAATADGGIFTLGLWQRPPGATKDWRIPKAEIITAVEDAFASYKVKLMYADPPYWSEEIIKWRERWTDKIVVDFPSYSVIRMAPAAQALYGSILEKRVYHEGRTDVGQHFSHCVAKPTPYGDVPVKRGGKDSPLHIDAAISSCLAYYAALQVFTKTSKPFKMLFPSGTS